MQHEAAAKHEDVIEMKGLAVVEGQPARIFHHHADQQLGTAKWEQWHRHVRHQPNYVVFKTQPDANTNKEKAC